MLQLPRAAHEMRETSGITSFALQHRRRRLQSGVRAFQGFSVSVLGAKECEGDCRLVS
jgi:hypothetical protein